MLKLSDQEKQDVIRYLEADEPLPDKYRFLLFEDKREVELVWNGKTNDVCSVVLPFQTIEHVDEPRREPPSGSPSSGGEQLAFFATDARGRQLEGWTNKLIWGDNKLILSSLKNGPLREEIAAQGGLKLIYIDPPFDVGADFSMDVEVGGNPPVSPLVRGDGPDPLIGGDSSNPPTKGGGFLTEGDRSDPPDKGGKGGSSSTVETFTKKPNILEEIAYRDTWGKGADSFIAMIYERLTLMRDLLAEDGSIYVHCDWRVNASMRTVMDEIFGSDNFRNEISWQRTSARSDSHTYNHIHDTIFFFTRSSQYTWNKQFTEYDQSYVENFYRYCDQDGRRYRISDLTASGTRQGSSGMPWHGIDPAAKGNHWKYSIEKLETLDAQGRIHWPKKEGGIPGFKRYLDEMPGTALQSIWTDISPVSPHASERTGYDTQKPEALIERIIKASSNEGDLVADFFCGSGTTAAVAEKLGRKWICTDLGKFAVHTTRKRMIGVQRRLKADGKDYRAFEILNLGKYERQHFVGINPDLREDEQHRQLAEKEAAFRDLILRAYRAEKVDHFAAFHGKKAGRLVAVGPVNLPVTRLFVEEIILECRKQRVTRVDILGFEFEMGLFPNALDEARSQGIDIAPKYIPAEVFDKRAVDRNHVVFHDVAFIEVEPIISYPPDKGSQPYPPNKGGASYPPDKGGKGGYLPYNTTLTAKARENRKNPTPAERKLWFEVLQNSRLDNLKFTRQKPLDEYIVDFYCAELMLAIEIDGYTHAEQRQYDEARTRRLEALGVAVVRYTNADVMHDLEGVYEDLRKRAGERTPPQRVEERKPPQSPLSGGLPSVAVELTDFSVFYSQDSIANAEAALSAAKKAGSRIVVERGHVVKVAKDKDGLLTCTPLTRHWTDWIDYWSVDFDFESKREIIRVKRALSPDAQTTLEGMDKAQLPVWEERWTGDYVFENEWQSFRTRKDRGLELRSAAHECAPGRRKLAVKVVDIFGNDTMTVVEVTV